jgi:hypothetical protein
MSIFSRRMMVRKYGRKRKKFGRVALDAMGV